MKAYSLGANERGMSGWTDCFDLEYTDLTAFSTTAVILSALSKGDYVHNVLLELLTTVTGPSVTPTASVGTTGSVTAFVGTQSVVATAPAYKGPTTALVYVSGGSENLIVNLAAGGGDGAAATAGKIRVWARISRAADRAVRG